MEGECRSDPSGEGGIRTHGTVSRTHAFQACQFSHSCTSPSALPLTAEGEGFEPSIAVRLFRFSRPVDSTTLAPFRMAQKQTNILKSGGNSNHRQFVDYRTFSEYIKNPNGCKSWSSDLYPLLTKSFLSMQPSSAAHKSISHYSLEQAGPTGSPIAGFDNGNSSILPGPVPSMLSGSWNFCFKFLVDKTHVESNNGLTLASSRV